MAEAISDPLLALIKERGLIDDLQYEEVVAEHTRTGAALSQVLQDLDLVDMDAQLQVMADYLGTEVVSLGDRELPPEVLAAVPAATARMYVCVPVALHDS